MPGHRRTPSPAPRHSAVRAALLAACCLAACCLAATAAPRLAGDETELLAPRGEPGRFGGSLTVALRAEPKTLNPILAYDNPSLTALRRIHADLVHINRATQEVEPALASRWTVSPDGRRIELELRRGVRFSDGEPFDADDVLFSFRVYLDPAVAAPGRNGLLVDGTPIAVAKLDSHRLRFDLAAPYASGVRLFDSVVMLPEHRLAAAYESGRLATLWGAATPMAEIVGLGPFQPRRWVAGERLELVRNPHYWKADAEGRRLPYLDGLTLLVVPSADAQVLRFQSGDTQLLDGVEAESFAVLASQQARRGYRLRDAGPGLTFHFLFFNLNDLADGQLDAVARRQRWFRQRAFRQAVSATIDRQAIVRLVFRGRATPLASPVTPGNRKWTNTALPAPRRDLAAARTLLREAGFRWDEAGRLRDVDGSPVSFSLITNAGNDARQRMATIIQEDLRTLGMEVRFVALELGALLERVTSSFDYDACLLGLGGGDGDPNVGLNVWPSNGASHLWHLGQTSPATPWEARIDALMTAQQTALDPAERKRLFDEVQAILAAQLPFIYLVAPNVLIGADAGLGNVEPSLFGHPVLWNAEELYWRAAGR